MKKMLLITLIPVFTYSVFAQSGEIDFFESHIISLILAWIITIPTLIAGISYLVGILTFKAGGHRIFVYWICFTIILFSPIRYLFLQSLIGLAYPVQSFGALFSTFFLALYIPIIFPIFWGVTVGLPIASIFWVSGFDKPTKLRIFLAGILAPFLLNIGAQLSHFALPYAAYSIRWLNPTDVISATNGPAEYFYKYLVEPLEPELIIQNLRKSPTSYAGKVGGTFGMTGILPSLEIVEDWEKRRFRINERFNKGLSSKERLRLHVASTYLSPEDLSKYMFAAHQGFVEEQGEYLHFKADQ
jgi:hypothetical protein